jgi:2-succinyl-6-hydroxy-2,4-cyclohexadiene-1-carboxylate synthase
VLATHVLHRGSGSERVVLLHGFTQNSQCWGPFAADLGKRLNVDVVGIDAPGHGASLHDDADLWETADLVAQAGGAGGAAHYVGYSMGGRVGLHVALRYPGLVKSLTLIGANPGIEDVAQRAARLVADNRLADQLLDNGLPEFLERWLAQPLFEELTEENSFLAARLTNRPEGLAANLRRCSVGAQDNLWPRLTEYAGPLLVMTGTQDEKFGAIAERIAEHRPNIDRAWISAAGHSAHLERPGASVDALMHFVSSETIRPT